MELIRSAKASQDDQTKQSSSLRSLPRNRAIVTTLDSLAAMIPEENGLSVLRGGLSLVFKVRTLIIVLTII